ncbi:MAG: hypothetical protein LBP53_01350 [Candidatus Peribacteria bacterium]|nr:hypothetical protein [Candidatus Peribacteria bacterium]
MVATGEGYGGFSYPIIYVGQNLRNGKIVFDVHTNEYSTNQLYSAVARLNSNGDYYGAYFSPLTNNINIVKVTAD